MSWVLVRRKGSIEQMFRNPDIYDNGIWKTNEESRFWEFPAIYPKWKAESILHQEQRKDPEWEYKVVYHDR